MRLPRHFLINTSGHTKLGAHPLLKQRDLASLNAFFSLKQNYSLQFAGLCIFSFLIGATALDLLPSQLSVSENVRPVPFVAASKLWCQH